MADKDEKKPANQPGFDPKPVQLGGESLLDRLLPHMKKIVIAIGITAAILTVIFTIRHFKERGRQKETAKLNKVIEVQDREVRPAGTEPDKDAKKITYANHKERAQAALDALTKSGASVSGTYRGSLLMQAGKVDEAIAVYRKAQSGKSLDAVLAREGLGIALETKASAEKDAAARQKGLEEALAAFQSMQPDEKGPRYAYALYHQGRILALLGKNAEAKTQLEKAKELGADTDLPDLIDQRLASLAP